jgi:hypothetical protein
MLSEEIDRDLLWKKLEEIRQHDTDPEKLRPMQQDLWRSLRYSGPESLNY